MSDRSSNLTKAQSLIWAGQSVHPGSPLYNMILTFEINGPVDPKRFSHTFERLVEQTDSLRTVFEEVDGLPVRRVLDRIDPGFEFVDLSEDPDAEAALRYLVDNISVATFDMGRSLFSSGLVKMSANRLVWWISQHHLITDGWSTSILFNRLESLYRSAGDGRAHSPERTEFPQFETYAEFENRFRQSEAFQSSKLHWDQRLSERSEIPTIYGRSATTSTRTNRITTHLGTERSGRLDELIQARSGSLMSGVTEFTIFATALAALLSRITDRDDLAILAPAHNRPSKKFKETAGLFIEVLPMHFEVTRDETLDSLFEKAADEARNLVLHGRPGTSSAESNRSATVLLNYINTGFGDFNGWAVKTSWVHSGHGDSDHALRIQIHDFDNTGDRTLHFDVSPDVFDEQSTDVLVEQFMAVLDAVIDDGSQRVADIELISSTDATLLQRFNATDTGSTPESVLDRFRRLVSQHPNAVAIRDDNRVTNYEELDQASDRLAAHLLQVSPGSDPVAIYLRRSPELLVAVWAALKSRKPYVPIDRQYPDDRIGFILEDSRASIVISDEAGKPALESSASHVLTTLPLGPEFASVGSEAIPSSEIPSDALAYIMYTSGSTGTPKGVRVTHGGLANYVAWASDVYTNGEAASFPLYSSFGFDLTVTSIFVPTYTGGEVVVYPEPDGTDLTIRDVFADDIVDVVKLTPSHLGLLDLDLLKTNRIHTLIVGGEDLKSSVARAAHDAAGGKVRIFNEYGPTEATVACMVHEYDPAADVAASVPLGRPAANTQIHILDDNLKNSPIAAVGELCVSGVGVSAGYQNRPEETRAHFLPDPFRPGRAIYRTGDLARWVKPGEMEFLGRADDQVKIRGFRIELGEIENALNSLPSVVRSHIDVIESERSRVGTEHVFHCVRCGLASNHPDSHIDEEGICRPCHFYEEHKLTADTYWGSLEELVSLLEESKPNPDGQDCIILLSGGKDSTYALYQMVELGRTPLVFTLDNGFISEGAKANIRRAVDDLGLELVMGATDAMNDIFADSLTQFSNVCQGCFKTVYTMSIALAHERGLNHIVTGLSRGQIFETRLADLVRVGITDRDEIDEAIIEARKAYHRMNDEVRRRLKTSVFDDDKIFEEIKVVDFYRYHDVGLSELLEFLGNRAPWVRPPDTGRSTNCLINNTGIYVHKKERGYHNYSLPYSWDVRLGHKTREAALAELDDDIDLTQVRGILDEIGYEPSEPAESSQQIAGFEKRLVGYYVSEDETSQAEVRENLARLLPGYMVPSYLVPLSAMPLTVNGKIDRAALPDPRIRRRSATGEYVAPRNEIETIIAQIWQAVLGVDQVGIEDRFTDLGGDSILNIQIVSRARSRGIEFSPQELFEARTIANLSASAKAVVRTPVSIGSSPPQGHSLAAQIATDVPELDSAELEDLIREFGESEPRIE